MKEGFAWHHYTKKCRQKILDPKNRGAFSAEDAAARKMHLAKGKSGSFKEGNLLLFYWLVDLTDGKIVDCKFQHYGDAILLAVSDVTAELLVGKNYDQAKHISAELIERMLRDKKDEAALLGGSASHLNRVLDAIVEAAEQCVGIALPTSYETPLAKESDQRLYPGWATLSKEMKLQVIEELFTEEIRPYIELDQGGVKILDLQNEVELVIAYEGACTSCYSSIGTTLSSIQNILRSRIDPSLVVVPNLDELTFNTAH